MKLTKQQLADIIYVPVIRDDIDKLASKARDALEAGMLEIEGYTLDKWTKFNPDDTSTYPPICDSVLFLVYWKHFDPSMRIGYYINDEFYGERGNYIRGFSKIFWRPLPPPPVETEAAK